MDFLSFRGKYLFFNFLVRHLTFYSPPGTGKTKTILGIVGSFLTEGKTEAPNIPAFKSISGGNNEGKDDLENMKRILICAPSNAAVDELVLRLKGGIVGADKKVIHPGIVRLGRSDAINNSVRELTLEELVDRRLEALEQEANEKYDGSLRTEQNENIAKREELREKQATAGSAQEIDAIRLEIFSYTKKIKETGHKLDIQREQLQVRSRKRDIERRKAQTHILRSAQVICATLSGSSHSVLLSLGMKFDTVIIDEAAQCIELSALIPLKYGCKQCIMVGDPNQLPPTVLSQHAASLKYEQSLFVRMFNKHPTRVHMLNVQFRMHPEIAQFPSREFYARKLTTGDTNFDRTKRDWHDSQYFTPYRFFDVRGAQEKSQRTKSLFNKSEAQTIYQFYKALQEKLGHESIAGKVGIISPYKQQVTLLKKVFEAQLGNIALSDVDFNTIDGFQGQEKDIIIISTVRAEADPRGVGFLNDTRRMNVAITRAKSALWIFGNERSLVTSPVWKRLIDDAKSRNMFTVCKPGFLNSVGGSSTARHASNSQHHQQQQRSVQNSYPPRAPEAFNKSLPSNNGEPGVGVGSKRRIERSSIDNNKRLKEDRSQARGSGSNDRNKPRRAEGNKNQQQRDNTTFPFRSNAQAPRPYEQPVSV